MSDSSLPWSERLRKAPSIRSITIGDTKLTYVPDGKADFDPRILLPETTPEHWERHREYLDEDGKLIGGIGGLLVERGDRAMLIDCGLGPISFEPPINPVGTVRGGALLDSLAKLGRSPSDIEAIAF